MNSKQKMGKGTYLHNSNLIKRRCRDCDKLLDSKTKRKRCSKCYIIYHDLNRRRKIKWKLKKN